MMMNQESNSSNSTLIDVSSFMLFESTGDSEFDSNICSTSHDPMDSFTYQRFLEDDDAQSCSYECSVHDLEDDEDMDLDFHIENEDNYDNNDDDDDDGVGSSSYSRSDNYKSVGWNSDVEDEDEGDVVEQGWNFGVNTCKKAKTKVRVDSGMEELKCQKDKDRLFWETCLAS